MDAHFEKCTRSSPPRSPEDLADLCQNCAKPAREGHRIGEKGCPVAQLSGGRWNPQQDARPWIRFVLVAHYRQAHTLGRRIRESERLWEAIDGEWRQAGLDERTMGSLYNAAVGLRVRRPDHID